MQKFIENHADNCFSGCMTVRNALKFWCDPRSISGRCDNRQAEIQCTIIRFLISSKYLSYVERNRRHEAKLSSQPTQFEIKKLAQRSISQRAQTTKSDFY